MNNKKFINVAKNVINLEIKALQNLKKIINSSFNQAVRQISKCQSKVILCGVGKSGLIASKISATLGPTNTGKTFSAIEKLLSYPTGVIGFPLRLLARENFDFVKKEFGEKHVALGTGE